MSNLDNQVAEAKGWVKTVTSGTDSINVWSDNEHRIKAVFDGYSPSTNPTQAMGLLKEMGGVVEYVTSIKGEWCSVGRHAEPWSYGSTPEEAICRAYIEWRKNNES